MIALEDSPLKQAIDKIDLDSYYSTVDLAIIMNMNGVWVHRNSICNYCRSGLCKSIRIFRKRYEILGKDFIKFIFMNIVEKKAQLAQK